ASLFASDHAAAPNRTDRLRRQCRTQAQGLHLESPGCAVGRFRHPCQAFRKIPLIPFIPKMASRLPIDPIPHDRSLTRDNYAPLTASRICCDVIGVRLNSTLNGRSASEIAFASAAGGPIGPPSPTPLTPNGLSGDGECW